MSTLSPSQIRAGRALLNLSRAEFGEACGVNERTIAAVELGENAPSRGTVLRIESAFRMLGIELIAEGGGRGAGVRLAQPEDGVTIIRRNVLRGGEEIGVVVRDAGLTTTARVAVAALAADGDTDAALEAFDLRKVAIANAIAKKLEAEACDADGHVRIGAADLASAGLTEFEAA